MSTAVTEGIRVAVRSEYRPERSQPAQNRYLFTYTVRITNEGDRPARLVSRHWIILNARGEREEVIGDGVVGQQPYLGSGEHFEYTSFCVLGTPIGSMHGSYQMTRDEGDGFEAEIAPFSLVVPGTLS